MASGAGRAHARREDGGDSVINAPPPYNSVAGASAGQFVVIDIDTPTDSPPPYSAVTSSVGFVSPTSSGDGEVFERGRSRRAAWRAVRRARRRAERRARRRSFGPGGLFAETPLFLPETMLGAQPGMGSDLPSGLPTYAEATSDCPPTYAMVMAACPTEPTFESVGPADQPRLQSSRTWRPPLVNSRELYRAQRAARCALSSDTPQAPGWCGGTCRHAVFGVVAVVVVIILVFLWR
ncbi:membrane protein UL56 [Chimpanzee herpesvirus strain 105640]|uniref:Membrane protein UL56 n=1 Tax=Chimpanzee herpesvirus strain 105640 TaxID=332937 RepID=K9MEX6_9ALPH|nr:membrane protein UL56 [Chimpanzee herpesvirus strain 105640]AFV26946.1 membrane protein UL56 [Chimpanzee herpesvirus strain 105640]